MTELPYSAWQRDTQRDESAILLAADARTVAMLNARAHNDRVAGGLVAPSGIAAGEDVTVGAGDRVVTRANPAGCASAAGTCVTVTCGPRLGASTGSRAAPGAPWTMDDHGAVGTRADGPHVGASGREQA